MFFFFQEEDGIRDDLVTGVQTCALPICWSRSSKRLLDGRAGHHDQDADQHRDQPDHQHRLLRYGPRLTGRFHDAAAFAGIRTGPVPGSPLPPPPRTRPPPPPPPLLPFLLPLTPA